MTTKRAHPRRLALSAALMALLTSCLGGDEGVGGASAAPLVVLEGLRSYQCEDLRIDVTFLGGEEAALTLPDRDLVLRRVDATAFPRFAAGGEEFAMGEGSAASLQLEGGERISCTGTGERSPWGAARGRGILFRAVGNEPGWWVEVEGTQPPTIRIYLDHGTVERVFPQAITLANRSGFRAGGETGGIELLIVPAPCMDPMSGVRFPSSVMAILEEGELNACGRFLVP